MPRPGYTNFPPAQERNRLFEIVCARLVLDPNEHNSRVQALDYALRVAAREIEEMNMDWIKSKYPKGARITTPSCNDPEATVGAEVINHYTGLSKKVEGIIVRDDDGNTYNIEAGFLDEAGGGV